MEIPTSSVMYSVYRPAAVLKITGEDAFSFLQGQFTQDLRPCAEGRSSAYGLWINQKGKVLADSFVLKRGVEWLVVSLFSPEVVIRERLESYIIADDVMIEGVTAQWSGLSVLGVGSAEVLAAAGAITPNEHAWVAAGGGVVSNGRRTAGQSWEWLYPLAGDSPVGLLRATGAQEISAGELERLRIGAGIPAVPRDIGPEDLPNEGGLERDAISYTKGCYLGQEVMARLKSMGQVRRRLLRVEGLGAVPADLPVPLFAAGKKLGELRSAVNVGEGFIGLAMISLLGMAGRSLLSFSPEGAANIVVKNEG
ncbi:MAG: folate-binding protein [Verrucomicrobia bacterium]|nr:folate-binding protein [Verrucomicrobiota bacterium]